MKFPKTLAYFLSCLLWATAVPFAAENEDAENLRGHGIMFEPRLTEPRDFQVGLRSGYLYQLTQGPAFALFLDGEVRPIPMIVHSGPRATRYWEERGSWGPGISAAIPLSRNWNATAAGGVAYSNAFYWFISGEHPPSGWSKWGEAGLRRKMTEGQYWGFGIQYRAVPEVSPVRIVLQYGYLIGAAGLSH